MKKETGEINVCATGANGGEGVWGWVCLVGNACFVENGRRTGGGILALARHMHGSTAYTYMVGTVLLYVWQRKKTWISGDRSAQMNGRTNGQTGKRVDDGPFLV